ncbi:MAG: sulfate ABC transporter substrate-binding protein [Hansschlegelia sp.]
MAFALRRQLLLDLGALSAIVAGVVLIGAKHAATAAPHRDEIVNVSYDPTREFYQALNPAFIASYEKSTGRHVTIEQSHGGSSRQAKKVISGEQAADVVSLGLRADVDGLRKRGLIADHWEDRLPNQSIPYTSTIVFVVRGANVRGVKDWPDLLQPGLEIVTPDPRTSGNGKLTALAAWLAVVTRGGSEADARAYLHEFYRHAPELAEGARGASTVFSVKEIGDVHVTWENEALREVAASNGKLQIVYPPVSVLAEPYVAWVDKAVAERGTGDIAKAYLGFLFTDEAQETIARLGYRPYKPGIAEKAGVKFAEIKLAPTSLISPDWNDLNDKFFSENGIVTSIVEGVKK